MSIVIFVILYIYVYIRHFGTTTILHVWYVFLYTICDSGKSFVIIEGYRGYWLFNEMTQAYSRQINLITPDAGVGAYVWIKYIINITPYTLDNTYVPRFWPPPLFKHDLFGSLFHFLQHITSDLSESEISGVWGHYYHILGGVSWTCTNRTSNPSPWRPRDWTSCSHTPSCIVTTPPEPVLITQMKLYTFHSNNMHELF